MVDIDRHRSNMFGFVKCQLFREKWAQEQQWVQIKGQVGQIFALCAPDWNFILSILNGGLSTASGDSCVQSQE